MCFWAIFLLFASAGVDGLALPGAPGATALLVSFVPPLFAASLILLTGWLASPEGQKAYDKIGSGSPFVEGSEKWQLMRKAGSKVVLRGWEDNASEEALSKKILSVWGLAAGGARRAAP